jgi:hypothetical protein
LKKKVFGSGINYCFEVEKPGDELVVLRYVNVGREV